MVKYFRIFSDNFKIYSIILLASIFVVLLGFNAYLSAKEKMLELSNANKITISQNLLHSFQAWFDRSINSLNRASKFIQNTNILQDEEAIANFLKIYAQNSPEFDTIQLLNKNGKLWANGMRPSLQNVKNPVLSLIWYIDTKNELAPTVHFMPTHYVLGEETLNFCVPSFYQDEFNAVLCGIVKLASMLEKVKDFKLPPNFYSFIATNGGEILTPIPDAKLKQKIENQLKERFLSDAGDEMSLKIDSNFISVSEIKFINWYVGVGVDIQKENSELLGQIGKNSALLLVGFLFLALLANILHNAAYAVIYARKNEYELLLTHKAKMGEIGELISGINHQFIQPVNSLRLIISTLINLRQNKNLDDEKLALMLDRANSSVVLLGDTIEIFRNFYKTSEVLREFSVRQSVKNLLTLMHAELSRANVSVNLSEFEDKKIVQIENIIQQILLILIHNAKDALVDKFTDDFKSRQIDINVNFDEARCYIEVSEYGGGVSEQMRDEIFQMPKTTKKFGNGLGLYFGKKLANEKIGGDIRLKKASNPTIFELSFDIKNKG